MKALSLTQPMAWAIFNGKDVENRTWSTKFRGRVYIHASKQFDQEHYRWMNGIRNLLNLLLPEPEGFVHGAIIGEVDIVGCVTNHGSRWFTGPYGFVLANPVEYKEPINYKGQLGFFNVSIGTEELQEIANLPCKGVICKVTGKPYENGFDQLTRCLSCTESDCGAMGEIFKGTPMRRRGL